MARVTQSHPVGSVPSPRHPGHRRLRRRCQGPGPGFTQGRARRPGGPGTQGFL